MPSRPSTLPFSATVDEMVRLTGLTKTQVYELLNEGRNEAPTSERRTLIPMDVVRRHVDGLPKLRVGGQG